MDHFGVWRAVHVKDNWAIPDVTIVKEFDTEELAKRFLYEKNRKHHAPRNR